MPGLMVDELCQFLVAFTPVIKVGNPGVALFWDSAGVGGGNLFGYEMPDAPAACVSIWPYGGAIPHLVDNIDEPTFQVRVRDVIATTGEGTIQAIFNAFQGIYERLLIPSGDWYWNRMFALQSPVYLGRDDVQRHEFCLNLRGFCRNPNRGGSGAVDH